MKYLNDIKDIGGLDKLTVMIDDEDYDRLSMYCWRMNSTNTSIQRTLNVTASKKKMITLANEVMRRFDCTIDHEDRNPLNNQKYNLRSCSYQQNTFNKVKISGTTSKYKGVCKSKGGKWRAYIKINSSQKTLGSFFNEINAAKAYNKAALELFKEFANLNKDENGNIL